MENELNLKELLSTWKTVRELAEAAGMPERAVKIPLKRAFMEGVVQRRTRHTYTRGRPPYEYKYKDGFRDV